MEEPLIALFDSHCHVDEQDFDEDRLQVLKRAEENGIVGIVNPSSDMASSERAAALATQYPQIYAAVGIHPHEAKDAREESYIRLAELAQTEKVVAIGEIGLDYYYDLSERSVQQKILVRQLDLARQLDMPFIIHDRDAHHDIMSIIKKEAVGLHGVFHCFSGSLEMAQELLKMGFYLSFGGPVTFKNANKVKNVVKNIPLERMFVETDSPYLTPHPHRGTRNEPSYVRLVAEEISRLKDVELPVLADRTTENVRNFFDIQ